MSHDSSDLPQVSFYPLFYLFNSSVEAFSRSRGAQLGAGSLEKTSRLSSGK